MEIHFHADKRHIPKRTLQ